MNVTVKYNLSQAGQKAAIIAGKPATAQVSEVMQFDDAALIDRMTILPDGSMQFDATRTGNIWAATSKTLYMDAPPADLASLIAAWDAQMAVNNIAAEQREREIKEREERTATAAREKAEHDLPLVEAILTELEALPLDASTKGTGVVTSGDKYFYGFADGLNGTAEQIQRATAIILKRAAVADAAKLEADRLKAEARTAMIAEHGGIVFKVEAGMCSFLGENLWAGGQTKRWVGIFSGPKGIDSFLDSPRGEHVFSVASLKCGECIQGGGYDTNSRGKRRNESEWFGVVVRNDETEIVIDLHDSRAATIKAAAKLR